MLRDGHFVRLLPFHSDMAGLVAAWYYSGRYRAFFRNMVEPYTLEELRRFDKIVGGQVFLIQQIETSAPVGLLTVFNYKPVPRVGTLGILIDEAFQGQTWCIEALIILGDYVFDARGLSKMNVEFLASDHHIKRITEKGGLVFEGTLFKEAYLNGEFHDEVRYSMSSERYHELYAHYLATLPSVQEKDRYFSPGKK